jgi:hypothetical protein
MISVLEETNLSPTLTHKLIAQCICYAKTGAVPWVKTELGAISHFSLELGEDRFTLTRSGDSYVFFIQVKGGQEVRLAATDPLDLRECVNSARLPALHDAILLRSEQTKHWRDIERALVVLAFRFQQEGITPNEIV